MILSKEAYKNGELVAWAEYENYHSRKALNQLCNREIRKQLQTLGLTKEDVTITEKFEKV